MTAITPEIVAEHGLSPDEYDRILKAIGREPNLLELGTNRNCHSHGAYHFGNCACV